MKGFLVVIGSVAAIAAAAAANRWTVQSSGVTARLRGVSAVSDRVVWASGSSGTVLRTIDGGETWTRLTIPDTARLDFRDIDAVSETSVYVLSIGAGNQSRIYKTDTAGAHWTQQFSNTDARAFFDAMTFCDARHGLVIGDSIDGRFVIIRTADAGATWTRVPDTALPPALANEGAFAASGSNIAMTDCRHAWIGTGSAAAARVLRTSDGGASWTVTPTPIPGSQSSGIFSVAFRDARRGVVVGGDYQKEREASDNVAWTEDGGATWTLGRGLGGYRSAVAFTPDGGGRFIAVGPSGSDVSADGGKTWTPVEGPGFDAFSIAAHGRRVGWGTGNRGAIGRLSLTNWQSGDHR